MSANTDLRVGAVAQLCEACTDTVRNYDRKGLITSYRDRNGHRRYRLEEVLKLRRILVSKPLPNPRKEVQK